MCDFMPTNRHIERHKLTAKKPDRNLQRHQTLRNVFLSPYVSFQNDNQSVGMGRRMAVLTPRTYTYRYLIVDDRISILCVLIHT